ncbi:Os03g0146200 [Oryza sativa Japonica Group]|uniref:Os03g0146200 protein n=1 Tax=Oryza sativa subsp. japonica TaxID=39947 RepID=Q0DV69_ORYSJ|nr:Os03g0146200 [Oryza sativa Japonica Group]|eukprot:NP_001048955.1 Os03g0146200 [Oryza sativa Japonica Group]
MRETKRLDRSRRRGDHGQAAAAAMSLVVGGGELLVGVGDEWANPVHPLGLPGPADEGRAEGDGRVHGGAVERAADEDVRADDEADGDGGDGAEAALLGVNGGGVHGVDEAEGHDDLQHQGLPHGDAGQAEGAGGEPAGGEAEEEARHGGAQELGDPVEEAAEQGDVAADEGAEGHGRVHVAAGDVGADGHRHEQGEGVGHRRRDQPGGGRRSAAGQLACVRA